MNQPRNFQEFIISLCQYWVGYGCIWSQPYDSQMGAGTFHPHTFLKGLGPEPWRSVYVQPCRRPVDGRYGKSPYRFQHYYQLQVLLKPSPSNIIDIFLQSLEHVGINLKDNDIGLLEDDWKGPTLGAWGLGWEVRANAQEVTQFTYFQQLGGLDIDVVCGEITYGLERLYMYAKGIKNALDIPFNDNFTLGDIYYQNEFEFSHFNFNEADVEQLFIQFEKCEEKVASLCEKNLVLPAYDYVLQASHYFNLLDARGAISVSERQRYIGRVRDCAKKCAATYKDGREKLGYPLLDKLSRDARNPILPNGANSPIINNIQQKALNIQSSFKNKDSVNVTLELGVEEMPPNFQQTAYKELNEKIHSFISSLEIKFNGESIFLKQLSRMNSKLNISSRRISLQFTQVPIQEPNQKIELWGPAERIAKNNDGTLTQAGIGFCRKNNIDPALVQFKSKPDGNFLYFEKFEEGKNFTLLIAEEFKNWIYSLNAPLKMKWLPQELSPPFIRPVRSIIALMDDQTIPLEMFGISSSNFTYGQRILSPQKIEIKNANEYEKAMQSLNIEISFEKRKSFILNSALRIAKEVNGNLILDENLLNKCAGLFESPYVFHSKFDESYLKLPTQLISSVLKEHMNYFTIKAHDGKALLPFYIGVANYKCNNIQNMIEGTKNVVTGRLDDGAFYFDTDLATPLTEFRERLKTQTFQDNMGTLYDKSLRLKQFASQILPLTSQDINLNILETAAMYCKADLKSGCVQEFPDDMQGVMGGILAKKQNILSKNEDSEQVALAIEQHYLPLGANSELPTNKYAVMLSLIDKLDSLCMMLNYGVELKGNKDPLGMRRLALSIVRLLGLKQENNSLNYSLHQCVSICLENMKNCGVAINTNTHNKVILFLIDRVKFSLKEDYDIRAVEALNNKLINSSIADVIPFIQVIDERIKNPQFAFMESLNPYRRARNLTLNIQSVQAVNTNLLVVDAEKNLYEFIQSKKIKLDKSTQERNYSNVLNELEALAKPLSEFFDNVMVNDNKPELKENRLTLLCHVRKLYEDIADFSILQV